MPRLAAPPLTMTYSAPAARAAKPFSIPSVSIARRSRRSEAIETWPFRAADRDAGRLVRGFAALGGDVSHQQSDELAVVVGDRSEKRALVASIGGDPAQLRLVLGAKRQAARLGEVDGAGRIVDRLRRPR